MKYLTIIIYVIYFIVYGYSCHMTIVQPNNNIWGYICTFSFAIIAIFSVNFHSKYERNRQKKDENS